MKQIASILKNNVVSPLKKGLVWDWNKTVHASFRKVVAFDLFFLGLGVAIGAGIAAAFLTGDITKILPRW